MRVEEESDALWSARRCCSHGARARAAMVVGGAGATGWKVASTSTRRIHCDMHGTGQVCMQHAAANTHTHAPERPSSAASSAQAGGARRGAAHASKTACRDDCIGDVRAAVAHFDSRCMHSLTEVLEEERASSVL